MQIPVSEIAFHPASFADPNGRLFWWHGEVFRAVTARHAALYRTLFTSDSARGLLDQELLVETEVTPYELEGYELVLRHRALRFVTYPFEWCGQMLKDAALAVLEIELHLAGKGLTLQDAHPWNVLFDGCRPVFVDVGSIVPTDQEDIWRPYDEYCRFFMNPLLLMAQGKGRIARWLLHDLDQGIPNSELAVVNTPISDARNPSRDHIHNLKKRVPSPLRRTWRRAVRTLGQDSPTAPSPIQSRLELIRRLHAQVEAITLPSYKTEWSDYYLGHYPTFSSSDEWTTKNHQVYRILQEIQPRTVLDIASNSGWYSRLAAHMGSKVVAFDIDEMCTAQLYHDAKIDKADLLPLVMDLRNPSPGLGICNDEYAPATERFACEMVLALALVHHLVFRQNLDFGKITRALASFTQRRLLVEFVPREDVYVSEWWSDRYVWYTLDNFVANLKQFFRNVEISPSDPAPRLLLLCEK